MDDHSGDRVGSLFAGRSLWWWASAALTAVAVVGAMVLLSIPI